MKSNDPAPSAASLAAANAMRAFDPKLSDDDLARIAREIDRNRAAAAALHAKPHRLRNGDEPVTRFSATEPLA